MLTRNWRSEYQWNSREHVHESKRWGHVVSSSYVPCQNSNVHYEAAIVQTKDDTVRHQGPKGSERGEQSCHDATHQ